MLTRGDSIVEVGQATDTGSPLLGQRQDTAKEIAKPVRPKEFRLFMAIPFVGLFILLAVSLAVLFIKARANGKLIPVDISLVDPRNQALQ